MIDRRGLVAIALVAACRVTTFEPVPFGVNLYVGATADRAAGAAKIELSIWSGGELRYLLDNSVATDEDLQACLARLVANAIANQRIVIDLRFADPAVEAELPAAEVARIIARVRAALPAPQQTAAIVQIHSSLVGP